MNKTTWVLDPAHSEIQFRAKHLMITNVTGLFTKYDITVDMEGDDLTTAHINFTADTDSVTTGNEQRDAHLKSADFFDVEKYPKINFVSTSLKPASTEGRYVLEGDMTIRGTTAPVTLDVEFGGLMKDPWGNEKAGFTLEAKINRKDWGLTWNAVLETGGLLVSEEVRIQCEVQFTKTG